MAGARRRRRAGPCFVSSDEEPLFGLGARRPRGCPRREAAPASPLLSPSSLSFSLPLSLPPALSLGSPPCACLLPSRPEAITDPGGCRELVPVLLQNLVKKVPRLAFKTTLARSAEPAT